ncbi:MAG: PKD domain-containing protein [Nitrospirae bacterium]|nr:PKD domain-containing protein [Candidatus Manganitrophaceae bacterium]
MNRMFLWAFSVLLITLPAYAAEDLFDRPNSPSLGSNWSEYLPNFELFDHQIRNKNKKDQEAYFTSSLGIDQQVAVDCKVTAAGNECGLMARWFDANNFYYLQLNPALGSIALFKKSNGVYTRLGMAGRILTYNTFYRLLLVVKGTAISAYFDGEGTPAITAVDRTLSTGSFSGIRSHTNASKTTYFDNFKASPASSPNRPPSARITADPPSGMAPFIAHLDGSASSDPDGTLTSYRWNLGDGTTASGAIIDHIYPVAGTFTVTLSVTDNQGAIGTSQMKLSVTAAEPWTAAPIVDGIHRYSHPKPFQLDNGDLLLGFTTNEDSAEFDYKLVRSIAGAANFPAATQVTVAQESGIDIYEGAFTQLTDPNRTLLIVYGAGANVRTKKSVDRGKTWGPPTTIATQTGNDPHPDLKRLSTGDLYLTYSNNGNIVGRRSIDGGNTWSGEMILSNQPDILRDPSIAETITGDLLVSFMNTGNFSGVQMVRSIDKGSTWSAATDIRGNVGAPSVNDANLLRLENGHLVLSYSVGSNTSAPPPALGTRSLYIRLSYDNGYTWQNETLIFQSGDPHRANFTQLADGSVLGSCATIEGDSNYHISKLIPPSIFFP